MKAPSRLLWLCFLALAAFPLGAGQIAWAPEGTQPSLVLSLGDGVVKKTVEISSATGFLDLTLKKFLLDEDEIQVVWKNDGDFWMSEGKKIPGDETTERVALPPGRQIVLEISTWGGTRVASIKLLRK
jgi:hypothetical protein